MQINRRRLLQTGAALSISGTWKAPSLQTAPAVVSPSIDDAGARPKLRWWLPGDQLDPAVLRQQVEELKRAGFGSAEIINMTGEGWGGARWRELVSGVAADARRQGLTLDFTVGPHWPAAVPGIDPDGPAAARVLVGGHAMLTGGERFDGPLPRPVIAPAPPPPPPPADGGAEPKGPPPGPDIASRRLDLVGVTAHRVIDDAKPAGPILLDRRSAIDLTATVQNGTLAWRAPRKGRWVIVAAWSRGSGKTADGVCPVIDHFSAAGVTALTDFWDRQLADPAFREAVMRSGGDWFEDSVELTQDSQWTTDMLGEIQRRRRVDMRRHLPVLLLDFAHIFTIVPRFDYADGTGQRLRNDYFETLTQLYTDHHLQPMKSWAHAHGLNMRQQPAYGVTINLGACGGVPDIPETESLWFAEKIDGYRVMAGPAHLAGRNVISIETDPVVPPAVGDDAWSVGYADLLKLLHGHFAGGVNQIVLHGFPYPTDEGATWPGYGPFQTRGGGLGEAWGAASPLWRHMPQLTEYLARLQQAMRGGRPAVDLAVTRHSYWDRGRDNWDAPGGTIWQDNGLAARGFSWDYVDPAHMLAAGSEAFGPDSPGYQALIVNAQPEFGASPAAPQCSGNMTLASARALVDLARIGVPIVLVGPVARSTPYYSDRGDDVRVARLLRGLAALPGVASVASQSDVPAALAALGVRPRAEMSRPTPGIFVSSRRTARGWDHFLYNQGQESTQEGYDSSPAALALSLMGKGAAIRHDLWSGRRFALGARGDGDDRLAVQLALPAHGATLISVSANPDDAQPMWCDQVSDTVTLREWSLDLECWNPGETSDSIIRSTRQFAAHEPKGWPALPDGEGVAGIGRYRRSVSLKAGQAHMPAIMRLGPIHGSAALSVNGRAVPVNQGDFTADLTGYLRAGQNMIEIEVASTLNNRLRVMPGGKRRALQQTGLIGPVSIEFHALADAGEMGNTGE